MSSNRFEMGKQDSSWRRVQGLSASVVRCLVIVTVFGQVAGGKPMSETLQRALSAVRGPSPGAKKLLNIPEDGADPLPGKHVPLESYESELEREHALPTSVPNADILKTNSNPTYHKPRPPQHHGAALLAGVGGGAAVPSYAPPGRAFFTPPLPPEYRNPFADKPTLRGTNTDGNNYLNRRPIPPPSLGPGHDRIPIRPPGQETSSPQVPAPPPAPPMPPPGLEPQKKKALNTPSHKPDELDSDIKQPGTDQANFTDFVPNSLNIPTISRILSGSNGRKEDIPDVLLRTVTAKPQHNQEKTSKSDIFVTKEVGVTLSDSSRDSSTEGSVLAVLDPEMNNLDRPLIVDQNGETNTRRNLQYATNKQTDRNDSRKDEYTPATTIGFELKDPEMSTERYHNLANVNLDKKNLKQDSKNSGPVQRPGAAWPFAWNLHIYLATVMFTILAVYSIFKIFCYNKYTHLFTQYYFIILHLILVLVCLLRIFYMCYDPYNINNSLPKFMSEILLHVPEIFLSIAFACIILFLLTNSINFKNTCCSFLLRPRIIIIGGSLHILSCLMLHIFESSNTINRNTQGVEKRVLGLTCQIIFIIACLTLGLCYLYVYKMLKTVLQKKSHTYINGFQNLQHAIQIKLATALLFILMAALQIFGIFGINQHNMTKFDWLQWGYQFSLRLLEVSIVALISWVISLKVGIALQHEKADGHKISGLGLFACGAGSSNEQFESDYPAICNTNTNLHTYTMRTGKPIYETTGHHPAMPEPCCGPVIDHQRFQLNTLTGNCDNNSGTENYSGHSSIANAGHSSSTESSNATSSQGVTNHLIKHHPNLAGYNGIESASDDHYSNCDPAIQSLQGDDPLDHEYNVIQYGSNSDFIRDIKNQNYNAGSNRSSHNFKHMSYDRVSSRTNSNPRKKHRAKNKNVQNCMTMGYDASIGHHYHQPHTPDEYGNYNTENASYHASGIQTLNPNRSYSNEPCQQIRSSQRRNSPSTSMVNSSGSQKRGKGNGFPDRPKSTDLYGFTEDPNERGYPCALGGTPQPAPRNCGYEASYSQPQDEIPTEAEGNSMLVAQDGFLRIRSMKDPSPNPQPSHT